MLAFQAILEVLFPARCLACKERGSYLCANCLSVAPPAERETAKWVFPIYDYRYKPIKRAVWLLKYSGKKPLAKTFAESIYGRIIEEIADLAVMENFTNPIMLPIPLSPKRKRERGFNQAELIAKNLFLLDEGKNFEIKGDILVKPKDTVHQAHLENRTERLRNLSGTFEVRNTESISGRNLILIDDVTTTGATLAEARKVLLEAGARKIIAFTFAH
jgi:competence protein ComFC